MLSQLTRRLTFCALAIAFAGILASCSQASPPLPPEPSAGGAAVVESQVITETPPTPTVEPTPTPTVEPTPTAAPKPELYPIDKTESFLDQIPAAERRCLLFRLKKDRLSDIIVRDDRASTEEIQAIGGCISGETAGRMFVGFVNREIDISLGTETSACISNGLKDTDGIALLLAFELIEASSPDDASRSDLGYDEAARMDVAELAIWHTSLCLDGDKRFPSTSTPTLKRCDASFMNWARRIFKSARICGNEEALGLEPFIAAENCGLDLEALLSRPEPFLIVPTPTATPWTTAPEIPVEANPAATAVPLPTAMAEPTPTWVPPATVVPVAQVQSSLTLSMTRDFTMTFTCFRCINQAIEDIARQFPGFVFVHEKAGFQHFMNGESWITIALRYDRKRVRDGATEFGEYSVAPVAFDGIAVMVNPENDFVDCLTIEEVQAIWNYGSSINNWNQVLSGFPDRPLRLYGQGHGTIGLLHFLEEMGGSDIRGDYTGSEGIFRDALIAGISADPDALGFIEYSDYTQFSNQVKLIAIDNGHGCVLPTAETILTGEYAPFSKPFLIYLNTPLIIERYAPVHEDVAR